MTGRIVYVMGPSGAGKDTLTSFEHLVGSAYVMRNFEAARLDRAWCSRIGTSRAPPTPAEKTMCS